MSYFRPNKSWGLEEEIHHMVAGELVAISYISTDCRRFVRVTVKMAVTEYTRDATGKIASMSLIGPVGDEGRCYHVQPCTTWMGFQQTGGLSWDLGKMVESLAPGSSGLAYVRECILQGAKDDSVIQDPHAWADMRILGREEYNVAREEEEAKAVRVQEAIDTHGIRGAMEMGLID